MSTSFSKKCEILSDVYVESGWNTELESFRKYNDIGLPMAYGIQHKFIETLTEAGQEVVDETWSLLCEAVNLDPDGEYQGTDDFSAKADERSKEDNTELEQEEEE